MLGRRARDHRQWISGGQWSARHHTMRKLSRHPTSAGLRDLSPPPAWCTSDADSINQMTGKKHEVRYSATRLSKFVLRTDRPSGTYIPMPAVGIRNAGIGVSRVSVGKKIVECMDDRWSCVSWRSSISLRAVKVKRYFTLQAFIHNERIYIIRTPLKSWMKHSARPRRRCTSHALS